VDRAVWPGGRNREGVVFALNNERGDADAIEFCDAAFLGVARGWSGNARQRMATEFVSAAVREATRAPDERPPVRIGRPRSGPARSCRTTDAHAASSCRAGAGLRLPATR